jgi:hypothetical protein
LIYELKRIVQHTAEDEAKSLLFQTLIRIHMAEDKASYTEDQLLSDLKRTYADFLDYKRSEANKMQNRKYKVTHIVFGDSASGSLNLALEEMELQQDEMIIRLSDLFSVGPVWRLHNEKGISRRHEWLQNHLNLDDHYLGEYRDSFKQTIIKINSIPEHSSIFIWAGDNAHEQTALRYVCYLLKDKTANTFHINTTKQFNQQNDTSEYEHFPLHTGEISHGQLSTIYANNRDIEPLSKMERTRLEDDWKTLSTTQEVLRKWENNVLYSVDVTYYDDYIIKTAEKLHRKRKNGEFMKSARLIGEVIGHLTDYIDDSFLEYRVRQLILKSIFEIKGVPKAMRFYSVRLRELKHENELT